MRGIQLVLLSTIALMTAPLAVASEPVSASTRVGTALTEPGGTHLQRYVHRDCVGPGLPGTAAPHGAAHTANVGGLSLARVDFLLNTATLFGSPGPCPVTATNAGVLPQDFTGTYRLTAKCASGTQNPGAVFLDWQVAMIAGVIPNGQGSSGTPCIVSSVPWSIDVTISISSTTFLGQTLPPTGGILLTISQ